MAGAPTLRVDVETFQLAGAFTISRGTKSVATVVTAAVDCGGVSARGECVPYPRYGETFDGVADAVQAALSQIHLARCAIDATFAVSAATDVLGAGAARNCVEAVCVDLHCKTQNRTAADLYGVAPALPVPTCATLSLGDADVMASQATEYAGFRTLKLKLDGDVAQNTARLDAVRKARPDAELIVDANEAWTSQTVVKLCSVCDAAGVTLIEQPLPADDDNALANVRCSAVLCVDESLHTRGDLAALPTKYGAINVKLDKTGGLREALALVSEARALNLKIMVGSMVSTSLSMAPALLLAERADWVDLDSPALLAVDRPNGLRLSGDVLHPQVDSDAIDRLWG